VVAAVLAGAVGCAWLLSVLGVLAVPAEAVMAVALMVLGAAVVVSARTDWSLSRHAWPVFAGLALIVGLFATSSSYGVGGAFTHMSIGNKTVMASGGTVYGGIGQLTVDASSAAPGAVIDVRTLVGQTTIVPPTGSYVVMGRVLAGQICTNVQSNSGIGAAVTPAAPNSSTVVIDVHQLAGTVRVAGKHCGRDGS
jgi:hypothetical protein